MARRPSRTRRCSIRAASSSCSSGTSARYTPELVERPVRRAREEQFLSVAEALCAQLGPRAHVGDLLRGRLDAAHRRRAVHPRRGDRPAAAGQHRPARRRHPRAARPRVDPGLDRHPDAVQHPPRLPADAARPRARRPRAIPRAEHRAERLLGQHARVLRSSLLKAWWGEHAHAENEFCFDYLPRIDRRPLDLPDRRSGCSTATCKGYFVLGENPAVGSANSGLHRRAMAALDWLVVRDLVETETATFWSDAPEIASGELRTQDIGTEVFFMPAAAHTEKEGTFTNTQRLLQWHHKAVEPPGDCRSELWFTYHLGADHPGEAGGLDRSDGPSRSSDLTWDYPTSGAHRRAERRGGAARDQRLRPGRLGAVGVHGAEGRRLDRVRLLDLLRLLCGRRSTRPPAASPAPSSRWVAPEWGWAWPANRRHPLQPRVGRPGRQAVVGAQALRLVGRGAGAWTGEDVPDFVPDKRPDYVPPDGARRRMRSPATTPFIMQADGRGWLFVPSGVVDGPLPTHYEPHESPVDNPLYAQQCEPGAPAVRPRRKPLQPDPASRGRIPVRADDLPADRASHGRRHEPVPSRTCPSCSRRCSARSARSWRPSEGSCTAAGRRSPAARAAIEARVLVTERIKPLRGRGRVVHQVGLPYHWGTHGLSTRRRGQRPVRDRARPQRPHPGVKAATCDIRPGRRNER